MPAKTRSPGSELVLEVITHELRGMIVPELEPLGGAGLKPSEVLMDALAEGFQGLEAGGPLDGMNAHTLGRAMVHRGEDRHLAVLESDRCRGIDAPHPVGTIGGDSSAMGLLQHGQRWALGRQQLSLPHQAQHPGLGGPHSRDPQARPHLAVSFPTKGRVGNLLPGSAQSAPHHSMPFAAPACGTQWGKPVDDAEHNRSNVAGPTLL